MSKEGTLKKLRIILDNKSNSQKNIEKKDEKYLLSLKDRLKSQNQTVSYRKVTYTTEDSSLEPKVTIHRRKQQVKISKTQTKIEVTKTELTFESEGLFEVEKTKQIPSFLEIKPKSSVKKEKEDKLVEWKVVEEKEVKPTEEIQELEVIEEEPKEEIPEWKIVEEEKIEPKEEIQEWEITEEKEVEPVEEIGEWEIIPSKKEKPVEEFKEIKPKKTEKKEEKSGIVKKIEPEEEIIPKDEITEIFKEFKSIDDKTAILLYEKGYKDVESLKKATIKDLKKIKGLKRKKAKEIIEDLEEDEEWEIIDETPKPPKKEKKKTKPSEKKKIFSTPKKEKSNKFLKIFKGKNKDKDREEEKPKEDVSEEDFFMEVSESKSTKSSKKTKSTPKKSKKKQGYEYKDYTLYEKKTTTKRGDKRTIRFFSKEKPDDSKPIKLPKDYVVKENKKTGVPYLKKKK